MNVDLSHLDEHTHGYVQALLDLLEMLQPAIMALRGVIAEKILTALAVPS